LKSPPVARVEKSRETRHNCTVPSFSAVTAPLTSYQPLSPMDAPPAPSSPLPPSPSSPVRRTPARTLIVIDCDPEDLGRAAAPIGPPVEPTLRRPSPYATMRARPREHRRPPLPLREGHRRICRWADSSRCLSDSIPSCRLILADWRRSMRVPPAAAGRWRRWFTLLKGGGLSCPALPRTRYHRAGCGSNRWRHRQPSRLHRPHRRRPQDLRRRLLHLQAAGRSFLPPEVSSPVPMA
jgi:hypothetical protein